MNCPCCSGRAYDQCCGRFISHAAVPENAAQLMRSRYSAFALGERDYLLRTWHADHRPTALELDPGIRWIGLEILAEAAQGQHARVEFEARLLRSGRVEALHEDSAFVRADERWWYTRGDLLAPRFAAFEPARNRGCPCGSGKKYKHCCALARRVSAPGGRGGSRV